MPVYDCTVVTYTHPPNWLAFAVVTAWPVGCIHLAVAGHHLMSVGYGRLTFQPACVFRGLNKGLNCVCEAEEQQQQQGGAFLILR